MALLDGKVALVSGIGPGLGAQTALAFAREGAKVVLMARTASVLAEVKSQIEEKGGSAATVAGSVTDAETCRAAAQSAKDQFGGLDIVVNNAFYQGQFAAPLDTDLDDWRRVMDVNLLAPLQMVKAAEPFLRERGGGSVIMVNSTQAWNVEQGFSAYAASKAGLVSLTQHLARDLGAKKIRVNSMHPGMIMEDSLRAYLKQLADAQGVDYQVVYDAVSAKTSLGHLPNAQEMAGVMVFLASDLSSAVTGQSLCVDCGTYFH